MSGRAATRLGLLLAGLTAGLLIAEIALRIWGFAPARLRGKRYLERRGDPSVQYHCYSSNPHGEFGPLPQIDQGDWVLTSSGLPPRQLSISEASRTPWCVEFRISDQQLRDRPFEARPPPGRVRIAMIGDSFVRGEGVPVAGALPKILEALLGAGNSEVMNLGFSGIGLEEEVRIAQEVAATGAADRAILVFIPNDIRLTAALEQRQEYINDLINIREEHLDRHEQRAWYRGGPRVIRLVGAHRTLRRITAETVQWYLDAYSPELNPEGLRRLGEDLHTLASLPGCRVALVIYPLLVGFDTGYPLAPIHERVAAMAREAGLPVLDLAPVFKGLDPEALQAHPADHHPNTAAHRLAARAIRQWLEQNGAGFPETAPAPAAAAATGGAR